MSKTWKDIVSALVSSVLVAVLGYVVSVTDFMMISTHQLLNIAILTGATSLLKSLVTTREGLFAGAIPIREPR